MSRVQPPGRLAGSGGSPFGAKTPGCGHVRALAGMKASIWNGALTKVARERRAGRRVGAVGGERRRRQVDVVLHQAGVRRAGLADLDRVSGVGPVEAVDVLPAAVQVVEAVVLLVDDDDVLEPRKPVGP